MQAAVGEILARLEAGLMRKLKFNVHGNNDEHWIKLNYKGYECFIYLAVVSDEHSTRITLSYFDNIDLRVRTGRGYTTADMDEAMKVYLARMKMFVE
ncbi:hypothetical protein D5b_00505 [Faustovirus]|nr:hypothetical protein D5b_00505 [Faustovirus]AMN84416.1 hypothetical protein D6_00003 [Faustovirus]AMP44443.1 hypothetical protein PRJ_Dakar_00493 [Faustovirus]